MSAVVRRLLWLAAATFAAAAALAITTLTTAHATTTFVVDNITSNPALSACTAAPDDCSLPGAVDAANSTPGEDTITFNLAPGDCPDGVCPIRITQGPLMITEAVLVDGTTQPQHDGPQANVCATAEAPSYPRIVITTDPKEAPPNPDSDAFIVSNSTGSTTIMGFAFASDDSPGETAAITLDDGSGHHIACNHFQIDPAGATTIGLDPLFAGVLIELGASEVIVGTDGDGVDDVAERNVFGQGTHAVYIHADDNTVAGNYVGITADGTGKIGSGSVLVRESSDGNVVGTNEDSQSDEEERNYFGSGLGVELAVGSGFADNSVVGNTFGLLPGGSRSNMGTGVGVVDATAASTGLEVRSNTFGSVTFAVDVAGTEAGASVLISDNFFGITEDGTALQGNTTAIKLTGSGSHEVSGNYVADSKTVGLVLNDSASLAAGSTSNCFVGNIAGAQNTTTVAVTLESNWWGAADGPSGSGPGSGDSVTTDIDFTPWLEAPPVACNVAPIVEDVSFDIDESASVGTVVGTVVATDEAAVVFAITAGDPDGDFAINDSGEITVARALDYETTAAYDLTVRVSDPLLSTDATVTIDVNDVFEIPSVATFLDVPLGDTFFANIEWLAYQGITRGCNPPANDLFCPDEPVTRGQMAAFLRRALGDQLVPGEPVEFDDDNGSIFEDDIEWLGAVRITKGCNPPVNNLFCPNDPVTRGQMAAFLVRAFNYRDGAGSNQFTDDDSSPFETNIEQLAHAGVTRGCNPPVNDLFCPNDPVTRAQMAAFLNRAMGN